MSLCQRCKHWVKQKRRVYGDGTTTVLFEPADAAKGLCQQLNMETAPDFGCNKYEFCDTWDHVKTDKVDGEPWQYWKMGPCPDCRGRGCHDRYERPACHRCAGTGNVRYYEDGFVGDEQYRRHPKEPLPGAPQVDPGTVVQPLLSAKSAVI